jgi:hypothetical protein
MMELRTSETSVNFNVITRLYIPEDAKINTRRRENLKSHTVMEFIAALSVKISPKVQNF